MAFVNIGSLYPTKIPGYEDAADIQLALRAYHYGSETYDKDNTTPSQIPANSIAGQFRDLDSRIDTIESTGIGSDYTATEPTSPEDGFIWVKSDTIAPTIEPAAWQLISSGSLSGSSVNITGVVGQKFYILLNNWSHNNVSLDGLRIRFNSVSSSSYVLSTDPTPTTAFDLSEFAAASSKTAIINVDLANTASAVKPVIFNGDSELLSGYYIGIDAISTVQISLANGGSFDGGTYQVWSYE